MRETTHAFVVRIWHEAVDQQGKTIVWRGSVENVNSGRRLHFDDLSKLVFFIKEQSGLEPSHTLPWWRSVLTRIRK